MNSQINLKIINARLPGYSGLQAITIDRNSVITSIEPIQNYQSDRQDFQVLDVKKDWLSLGGVDLQINGALGLAFPDLEVKDLALLDKICDFLWQNGIDAFLPTIVTTSLEKIQRSLAVISQFMGKQKAEKKATARVLGVHLEGPFLNYEKRGAHPAEYLLSLTIDNIKNVLGDFSSIVKIITLAPELSTTNKEIGYLNSLDITISLGHSLANSNRAKKAFKSGASMVTHAFNAMPSLHHRQPGLLGEAIINKNVYCGLIADGKHVCPTMIQLLIKASDFEKGIFLVSDALAPIGLNDGIYPWDDREIEVKNGTAKLLNGTLAGTTLPLLVGVENLVKWDICDLESAIAMATESPRKAINLPGIDRGYKGHLLRWYWDKDKKNLSWERLK
ncbi:MAG: N-acetylglucosamine-6-phosphate deacetylase [Prochloraceae cyanobacterium]